MVWSVCIFAHNEERLLPRCLAALDGAAAGAEYVVHVIENGSNDETARVARAFAAADPRVRVHELALADKSSAWNEYVHRIAGDAEMHIFLDGDIQPSRGAFKSLSHAFAGSPKAFAAAALPTTGRSRKAWASRLFTEHYLSGNLYAISANGLSIFRERAIRLPIGSVGEDGLLSYILVTDFKGGPDDKHRDRIAIAAGAFFEFDSLGFNLRDLAIYRRRLSRYSKRFFQNETLY
ncbi:MAG TPA: glycosyltransferase, partial [Parvularculaceae bacterium]|nr:glycosyltransferase [Parvularculaceae bacterium]